MLKFAGKKFNSGKGVLRKEQPKYHLVPNKTGTKRSWMLVDHKLPTPPHAQAAKVALAPKLQQVTSPMVQPKVKPVLIPMSTKTSATSINAVHQNPLYQKTIDNIQPNHISELNSNGLKVVASASKHAVLAQDKRLTNEHITSEPNYSGTLIHSAVYSTDQSGTSITSKEIPPEHNQFIVNPKSSKLLIPMNSQVLKNLVAELHGTQVAHITLPDATCLFISRDQGQLKQVTNTKGLGVIGFIDQQQEDSKKPESTKLYFTGIAPEHVASAANQVPSKKHSPDFMFNTPPLPEGVHTDTYPDGKSARVVYDMAANVFKDSQPETTSPTFPLATAFNVNRLDPQSMTTTFNHQAGGTTSLMKESQLDGHAVHTVAIHDLSGNVLRYESYFQIRKPNKIIEGFFSKSGTDISSQSTIPTAIGHDGLLSEVPKRTVPYALMMYDPDQRMDEESNGVDKNLTPYYYKSSDGTELVYHRSNMDTYRGLVTVTSHNSNDVERNVQNALKLVGLNSQYASSEDVENYRAINHARAALSNKEFQEIKGLPTAEIYARVKARYPGVTNILDPNPTQFSNGHVSMTFSNEFFDKVIAPHVQDMYHSISGYKYVPAIMSGVGLLSTVDRFRQKMNLYGMSSVDDIENGGGQYIYTRLSPNFTDVQVGGQAPGGVHLRIDPQALRMTDQYSYATDAYGMRDKSMFSEALGYATEYKNRKPSWEVSASFALNSSETYTGGLGANETMIKHSLPPEFIKGIDYIYPADEIKAQDLRVKVQAMYDSLPSHIKNNIKIRIVELTIPDLHNPVDRNRVTSITEIGGHQSVADFPF
jgi:hypothetical protein